MAGPGALVKRRAPASADREIHEMARDRTFTKGRACVDPQGRQLCLRQYYRNGSAGGIRNFEFHDKLSMQVQRRIIAIGSSGTHATDKPCLLLHPNYDQPERRLGPARLQKAGSANRLYPLKPPPVFRTSASRDTHWSMDEVSAPLTGPSKKTRGRAVGIIVPSRRGRMPKGKCMAGLGNSV